jgi:hypothetical protein
MNVRFPWLALAAVPVCCTRPPSNDVPSSPRHAQRTEIVDADAPPVDAASVDADARGDRASEAPPVDDASREPAPLAVAPSVLDAPVRRAFVDRTTSQPLPSGTRIEVRFDVATGSHHTRSATYQTLFGILRAPQIGLERRIGGSAAPTSCESHVEEGERAMFFRCAGDVEDAHGRVWIDGNHLMLVLVSSRANESTSGAPPGAIERFTLPESATVQFRAARRALGM